MIVVQKWEESEAGWGTRPDGYSLHRTEEDRLAFVTAYWDSMPDRPPAEYSRPDGKPYEVTEDEVRVLPGGDYMLELIAGPMRGVRHRGPPAGNGGTHGWLSGKRGLSK